MYRFLWPQLNVHKHWAYIYPWVYLILHLLSRYLSFWGPSIQGNCCQTHEQAIFYIRNCWLSKQCLFSTLLELLCWCFYMEDLGEASFSQKVIGKTLFQFVSFRFSDSSYKNQHHIFCTIWWRHSVWKIELVCNHFYSESLLRLLIFSLFISCAYLSDEFNCR